MRCGGILSGGCGYSNEDMFIGCGGSISSSACGYSNEDMLIRCGGISDNTYDSSNDFRQRTILISEGSCHDMPKYVHISKDEHGNSVYTVSNGSGCHSYDRPATKEEIIAAFEHIRYNL